MKKSVFTLVLIIATFVVNAQIKVHNTGQISLQDITGSWNNGIQIYPSGCTHFNISENAPWNWATVTSANNPYSKCWIVTYPNKNTHNFFVTANGFVYKKGSWKMSDSSIQNNQEQITDASSILDQITGFYYSPNEDDSGKISKNRENAIYRTNIYGEQISENTKRCVGISAKQVEKFLPEAVCTDADGVLYLDYEALTVFLIEGYKEQQQEIKQLRKVLEKSGLIKKGY
jgi:hypothetical protein